MLAPLKSLRINALFASATPVAYGSAWAANLKVNLIGAEETPPVTTTASGTGTIKIAADKSVSGSIKTSGIDGTGAHVHVHVGPPGQNIPFTLTKVANGMWSDPKGSKLTDEQYASFKTGHLYVNVHSAEHEPGEIRGQLKP
jgi:hypothetical protein